MCKFETVTGSASVNGRLAMKPKYLTGYILLVISTKTILPNSTLISLSPKCSSIEYLGFFHSCRTPSVIKAKFRVRGRKEMSQTNKTAHQRYVSDWLKQAKGLHLASSPRKGCLIMEITSLSG